MHVLRSEKRREESVASVVVAVTSGEILGDPEGAALIKTKRKATVTAYQRSSALPLVRLHSNMNTCEAHRVMQSARSLALLLCC